MLAGARNFFNSNEFRDGSEAGMKPSTASSLLPRKRAFRCAALGDAPGHKRVNALGQILSSFDYLAGLNQQNRRNVDAERSCHLLVVKGRNFLECIQGVEREAAVALFIVPINDKKRSSEPTRRGRK
jgi:hypothetical protein